MEPIISPGWDVVVRLLLTAAVIFGLWRLGRWLLSDDFAEWFAPRIFPPPQDREPDRTNPDD